MISGTRVVARPPAHMESTSKTGREGETVEARGRFTISIQRRTDSVTVTFDSLNPTLNLSAEPQSSARLPNTWPLGTPES